MRPANNSHCQTFSRARANAVRDAGQMEAYHSGTDDILGVCGDEETETGLAHTPRYEPSWYYHEVPSEMVERCLRARRCGTMRLIGPAPAPGPAPP